MIPHQEWDKQLSNARMLSGTPPLALCMKTSATFSEKTEWLMYPEPMVTTLGAQMSRSVTLDLTLPFDGGGAVGDPPTNGHNDGDREELGLETCCHNLGRNHNLSFFATTCWEP